MPRMTTAMLATTLALVAAAGPAAARGDMIIFTYTGTQDLFGIGATSSGTGSFAFADGLTTVGLADLTAFNFVLTTTVPNASQASGLYGATGTSTFTFGLANISPPPGTSFSATIGPGGRLTSLSLFTTAVRGTNPGFTPEVFAVSGTSASVFNAVEVRLQNGTIAQAVPEPSSLALCGVATLVGLGAWGRRRAVA